MLKGKNELGLSLIEMLMALVIAGGIILYSSLQYVSYRREADAYQLGQTVDLIFQAMAEYFRANCAKPGHALSQSYTGPSSSLPITFSDLRTGGFLTEQIPFNPYTVTSGVSGEEAYVMQFNQVQPPPPVTIPLNSTASTAPSQATVGSVLIWNAQVSVRMYDINIFKGAAGIIEPDCFSVQTPGFSVVTPCNGGPEPPNATYAVWMRLPSLTGSSVNSTYWTSMPVVRQFTQTYSTYPVITEGNKGIYSFFEYFVCTT